MTTAYDEILDFVTSAPTLSQIVEFQHSRDTIARVTFLQQRESLDTMTKDEAHELKEFRKAAYFIEQLKIRAQRRLAHGGD